MLAEAAPSPVSSHSQFEELRQRRAAVDTVLASSLAALTAPSPPSVATSTVPASVIAQSPITDPSKVDTLEGILYTRKARNINVAVATNWSQRYVILRLSDGGSIRLYRSYPIAEKEKENKPKKGMKAVPKIISSLRPKKKGNKCTVHPSASITEYFKLHSQKTSALLKAARPLKRHSASLNLGDSLELTKASHSPVDQPTLYIPAEVPWIMRNIANTNDLFRIELPPLEGNGNTNVVVDGSSEIKDDDGDHYDNENESKLLSTAKAKPVDSKEVSEEDYEDEEEENEGNDRRSGLKNGSLVVKSNKKRSVTKTEIFYFRCPGKGNEKDLWLRTAIKLDRLAAEPISSVGGKMIAHVEKARNVKSRTRSKASSQLARGALLLERELTVSHFTVEERQKVQGSTSDLGDYLTEQRMSTRYVGEKEYKVFPTYAYPHRWMTYSELYNEMVRKSAHFHDLRTSPGHCGEIGTLSVEVLGCIGLPKLDRFSSTDAVCYLVCGSYAFSTDVIPDSVNPMWPRKSRRACIMPLYHAYARLYAAVFDDDGANEDDDFAGRVVVDLPRLRPGSTYDVTLPLRLSSFVYMRRSRGSLRLRFRVDWNSERAAVLSYLPKMHSKRGSRGNKATAPACTVSCADMKAFRNVAITVHGAHLPERYNQKIFKATLRELKLYRIALKLLLKQTVKDIVTWENPAISLYVFMGWMHCVFADSVTLFPTYFIGYLLMVLARNYARYNINVKSHRGFAPLTFEELFGSLVGGGSKTSRHNMKPLEMERSESLIQLASKNVSTEDESNYTTHQPFGQSMFNAIGFFRDDYTAVNQVGDDHMEFPFSSRNKYPSFTVEEAKKVHKEEPKKKVKELTRAHKILRSKQRNSSKSNSSGGLDDGEDGLEFLKPGQVGSVVRRNTSVINMDQERILETLPEQNVDIKVLAKKAIKDDLMEVRDKFQELTLRTFDNRSYIMSDDMDTNLGARNSSCFRRASSADLEKTLGIRSHSNPVVAKTAVYLGPIVGMMQIGLAAIRALFNVFMWKDPYLSFWLSITLSALAVVLVVFPWRSFMLLIGIATVGPQNWVLRLLKNRSNSKKEGHPQKAKSESETGENYNSSLNESSPGKAEESSINDYGGSQNNFLRDGTSKGNALTQQPIFSCHLKNFDGKMEEPKNDASAVECVVVPYSRLTYNRFYDWPPEPSFARVSSKIES